MNHLSNDIQIKLVQTFLNNDLILRVKSNYFIVKDFCKTNKIKEIIESAGFCPVILNYKTGNIAFTVTPYKIPHLFQLDPVDTKSVGVSAGLVKALSVNSLSTSENNNRNIRIIKNDVANSNIKEVIFSTDINSIGNCHMGVISHADSKIQILYFEQIASFVEIGYKSGNIGSECAQKIRDNYKHILTGLQTTELPKVVELQKIYIELHKKISSHLLKAKENGKKTLILGSSRK